MVASEQVTLIHIFVDHSNVWGGARGASRIKDPKVPDISARVSIRNLNRILGGERQGLCTKIVSGGIPPGMEGVWAEYQNHGYDTQRLVRDDKWKERGVDHTIIGHMWRLLVKYRDAPTLLVLASGDGRQNEFGTSFLEVLEEILDSTKHDTWQVHLASFDWEYPNDAGIRSPTSSRMKRLIARSERGNFINLFDVYEKVVYHKEWTPVNPGSV
jgi:hypothetical protein